MSEPLPTPRGERRTRWRGGKERGSVDSGLEEPPRYWMRGRRCETTPPTTASRRRLSSELLPWHSLPFQLASNPLRKRACTGKARDLGSRILYVSKSQSEVSRSSLLSPSPPFHLSVCHWESDQRTSGGGNPRDRLAPWDRARDYPRGMFGLEIFPF